MDILYTEFLILTEVINRELKVTPVLYGSLGLGKLLGVDFEPQDIDFLISGEFVKDKWEELKSLIVSRGYILEDEGEHQFFNGSIRIAFADMEVLKRDLNIEPENLIITRDCNASFRELDIKDYLKAYEFSSRDGYRREKKSGKDLYKIQSIKEAILEFHR